MRISFDIKRSTWKVAYCPVCGNPEWVQKGKILKLCAACFITSADNYDAQELAKSRKIDWRKTLIAVKRESTWNQSTLAHWLKIPDTTMSDIKAGRRAMLPEAFQRFQERFSKEITYL